MLTARENLFETIKPDGHPDRYVNQYEAFNLLFHPRMTHLGGCSKIGDVNKITDWGVYQSWPEGTPGQFPVHDEEHLLVKDIENWRDYVKAPSLKFPEAEWEQWQAIYEQAYDPRAISTAMVIPGIFEQTHHMCSMVEVLVAYMTLEDEMHDMIKYLTEWELEMAEGICSHLHPEGMLHHDDWGSETNSFLRPEMFEDYFLEPYKELYGYYHDHGVKVIVHHSDSYCANLVDYMIEMGIDIWQGPMETNNVPELVEKYKGKITFMGNIDNKDVDFEGCTEDDAKKVARRAIADVPAPNSYIPCINQGGPGSVYPNRYQWLLDEIDQINSEKFGHSVEELQNARMPTQIMFG